MDDLNNKNLVPRKIWLLWYQGLPNAPFVVQQCIESWQKHNPTWEITVLDEHNLAEYVKSDLSKDTLSNLALCHQSDLIRLQLLSKYGGVWADATTFCRTPLDLWIDDYTASSFFAFSEPGKDRLISNWFLSAHSHCPIIDKLYENQKQFWAANRFSKTNFFQRKTKKLLSKVFNRNTRSTKLWFHPVVTKTLKIYPYFVFHYLFERIVSTDTASAEIWGKTKKIPADLPHMIQQIGLHTELNESLIQKIQENSAPLFKLTWKYDSNKHKKNTPLHFLIGSE